MVKLLSSFKQTKLAHSPEGLTTAEVSEGYPAVSLLDVTLGYNSGVDTVIAAEDITLTVATGERVTFLGPSGCGKTTALNAIGGFIKPIAGSLRIRGKDTPAPGPDRVLVFQNFDQLFPWRTVLGNTSYPLRVARGYSKTEANRKAAHFLDLMGLTAAKERLPHQLSGGMKQRTAIARALSLEPSILLMDEPFGSLDALTRTRLQYELNMIVSNLSLTLIFVTHSIQEAVLLGDRVAVFSSSPGNIKEILDTRDMSEPDSDATVQTTKQLRQLLETDHPVKETQA